MLRTTPAPASGQRRAVPRWVSLKQPIWVPSRLVLELGGASSGDMREVGVIAPQGPKHARELADRIETCDETIPIEVCEALAPLVMQLRNLDEAIARLERTIAKLAQRDETLHRLSGRGPCLLRSGAPDPVLQRHNVSTLQRDPSGALSIELAKDRRQICQRGDSRISLLPRSPSSAAHQPVELDRSDRGITRRHCGAASTQTVLKPDNSAPAMSKPLDKQTAHYPPRSITSISRAHSILDWACRSSLDRR